MRVGVVVPGFCADDKDWCIPALTNLIRQLSQVVDVVVFSLRYPHNRSVYSCRGAKVVALGGAEKRGVKTGYLLKSARQSICREHAAEPFDLLHAFWAHEPGWVVTSVAKKLNIPKLVSIMGGELVGLKNIHYGNQLHFASRRLIHAALSNADLVTVGSQTLLERTGQFFPGNGEKKVRLLPLGVNTSLFHVNTVPATLSKIRELQLLHVGSLVAVKNYRFLFTAVKRVLETQPAHLHLCGDGPLLTELQRLGHELGMAENVTFHGEIGHEKLANYYQRADLLLVTSHFESQGMVVLEAGGCGLPTVGADVGMLPELQPGVVCIQDDKPETLAQAILSLVENPQKYQKMCGEIRAKVEKQYFVEHTTEALLKIYEMLLSL